MPKLMILSRAAGHRSSLLASCASVLPGRPFHDEIFADVESLFATFYHVTPTTEQLRTLVGSSQ